MSGIALLVPRKEMERQAHNILQEGKYKIDLIKTITTQEAVNEARKAVVNGINIVIARGLQASLIKRHTNLTVVEMNVSGQAMGLLIKQAKKIVNKDIPVVGVIGPSNLFCDMSHFNSVFGIDLHHYNVGHDDNYTTAVKQAISDQVDIIIGGDTVVKLATEAGVHSLFLESTEDTLRTAFQAACLIKETSNIEGKNKAQIDVLFENSFSGMIRIDRNGRIIAYNHIIEELFVSSSGEQLTGKYINELITKIDPESLNEILHIGEKTYYDFMNIRDKAFIVSIVPIKFEQEIDGAIVSCQTVKIPESRENKKSNEKLLKGHIANTTFDNLKARSRQMRNCIDLAKLYSQANGIVCIKGECGTEGEQLAQSIHNNSIRRNGPFVSVNCNGMTDEMQAAVLFGKSKAIHGGEADMGACGISDGGTLFLNEIDKLTLHIQYRLCRTIRNNLITHNDVDKVMFSDVRLIAMTSENLYLLTQRGLFCEELFYLMNSLVVEIPPLRERKEDLLDMIEGYVKQYMAVYKRFHVLTEEAKHVLSEYPWNGNITQLSSFCERMILSAKSRNIDEVYVKNLIGELYPIIKKKDGIDRIVVYKSQEAAHISEILDKYHGNRSLAAEELGISKTTLWRHMKRYAIENKYNQK